MGLFTNLLSRPSRQVTRAPRRMPSRPMQVEQMEDRRMMAADVLLGAVYLEDSTQGQDNAPDTIRVSFVGGAAGTTLDRIVIDGDKLGNGASNGDIFFDIADGGAGSFGNSPFSVVSSSGFTVTSFEVIDGGTRLVINLDGFEAGEELVFSVDVDEYGETLEGLNSNAFAEGGEFEGSILTGSFSAPGFVDLTLTGTYFDFFDSRFTAAEQAAGAQLTKLPGDNYDDPNDPLIPVRTAGAVAHAPQVELARISGYVYHDKDNDGVFDTTEAPIAGVTLELLNAAGQGTGVFTTTNSEGYYQFTNLIAGTYGVRETQPGGWLDGKDTIGSKGGSVANDLLTGAVLNWGDRGVNYNFGELLPGSIAGRVGANNGPDCKFDNPDVPLGGVTIQLLDANGKVLRTTLTDSTGRYKFEGLPPGEYQIRELQPTGYYDGGERAGTEGGVATNDLVSGILIDSDEHGIQYDFCEKIGAQLSGYVYHDRSNEGSRDPGEEPIQGVTLNLVTVDGIAAGYAAGTITFQSGASLGNGTLSFPIVASPAVSATGSLQFVVVTGPGTTTTRTISLTTRAAGNQDFDLQIVKAASADIVDSDPVDGILASIQGNKYVGYTITIANDTVVDLDNLASFLQNNIDELDTATINGSPSQDLDLRIGGAAPLGQIAVTGSQAPVISDTTIAISGVTASMSLSFVRGTVVGTGTLANRVAVSGNASSGYFLTIDDSETVTIGDIADALRTIPGIGAVSASNFFTVFDTGTFDPAVANTTLTKGGVGGLDVITVTAASTGAAFNGTITFNTSYPVANGISVVRSGANLIVSVHATSTYLIEDIANAIDSTSGFDAEVTSSNGSGVVNASNFASVLTTDLVGGQTAVAAGGIVKTAVTDSNGYYQFTNLKAGTYRVIEVHPAGWLDGIDTPGSEGGVANNPGDMLSEIVIQYGDDAINYNFGEILPGSISGRVGGNYGPDCKFDDPDVFISGVTIQLLDAAGNVLRTTTTDALGEYRFDNLAPGQYQVRELQPTGWFDGGERVGTAGGVKSNDLFSQIVIGSGVDGIRYDFCEHVGAKLSGFVYHDRDNDGIRDPGEDPIPGVTVKLLRGDGTDTGLRATTNTSGYYQFTGLDAGKYRVMEVHPEGWLDGIDTEGSKGGVPDNPGDMISEVMLDYGDDAIEYNFGEILPASIAGGVYWSPTGDCACDCDNKSPLSGVTVELLNEQGAVIAWTLTDDAGQYRFDNLPPGTYTVREQQPTGYFDGGEVVGSEGGVATNDLLSEIVIGSGVDAIKYDFCEIPPAGLAGFVFVDGPAILSTSGLIPGSIYDYKDGVRTADDAPIANVVLRLVNGTNGLPFWRVSAGGSFDNVPEGYAGIEVLPGYYEDGVFEITTDANGYYQFLGLPAGSYAVVQVQPVGYIDSLDTPGTNGGVAVNPTLPGQIPPPDTMAVLYGQNVIYSINLTAGDFAVENNFSEVTTFRGWLPPVTPPITPPNIPLDPLSLGRPGPWAPLMPPPRPGAEIYGGSSQAIGYTWHLSVINAGQPREFTIDGARVKYASQSSDDIWKGADRNEAELSQAKWRLLANDIEGAAFSDLLFGSEDAIPVAGDWNGDGVTDVGVFLDGDWYLDLDGDGRWSEGDLWAQLGSRDDLPVTGDWDGDGKTDIGIYGPAWPRDPHAIEREPGMPDYANHPGPHGTKAKNLPPTDNDATSGARLLAKLRDKIRGRRADVIDHVFHYGTPGDVPVTGDWNGEGIRTIGVFRDGQWTLDANGDGRFDEQDRTVMLGQAGDLPLVGDFNGDGVDDLGVYRAGRWMIDANGDGELEEMELAATDQAFAAEVAGKPIVGDWDGDGVDEPALVSPVAEGEAGEVRVSLRKAG